MNKEIEILVEDQLIPIKNNDGRTVVNARDLHEFLESRKDFSSWIKDRIERYDLTENEDYVVFTEFGENSKGGRPNPNVPALLPNLQRSSAKMEWR